MSEQNAMRYAERLAAAVETLSSQLDDLTRETFGASEETEDIMADLADADALLGEYRRWRERETAAGHYLPADCDESAGSR